jgi:hypothetical protein
MGFACSSLAMNDRENALHWFSEAERTKDPLLFIGATDHMCFLNLQMVKESDRILYSVYSVRFRTMGLVTFPAAANINCDNLEIFGKLFDQTRSTLHFKVISESMNQKHRFTFSLNRVMDFAISG